MSGWEQKLPAVVTVVNNRKKYVVDLCRDKSVLHIGCVDAKRPEEPVSLLHKQLNTVANRLVGIDSDRQGLEEMKKLGYTVDHLNVEGTVYAGRLRKYYEMSDVVVATELLEHLDCPGTFLNMMQDFQGDFIISVPNAFSLRIISGLNKGYELVHADHVSYYSASTLAALLGRYRFGIKDWAVYYYDTGDSITNTIRAAIGNVSPFVAEGIIVVAQRNGVKSNE